MAHILHVCPLECHVQVFDLHTPCLSYLVWSAMCRSVHEKRNICLEKLETMKKMEAQHGIITDSLVFLILNVCEYAC